ncbi:ATP-dependent zinc metalloprotease FtsH [compost metagenome]
MVESLGHVAHEPQRQAFLDVPGLVQNGWQPGPETRQRIDEAVRSTVMQAFEQATHLLQDRRELLERCARALLTRETLDADALRTLTGVPGAEAPVGATHPA